MKLITREVPLNFNLWIFGDRHCGNPFAYKKGWGKLAKRMNSPHRGVDHNIGIDVGDVTESVSMRDIKRFSPAHLSKILKDNDIGPVAGMCLYEAEEYIREARKIGAEKYICILNGNHPKHMWPYFQSTQYVCRELKIPYGTWSAKVTFVTKSGRQLFKVFATHGKRTISSTADDPARRKTNMELILKRLLKEKHGDCIIKAQGHCHKILIHEPTHALYLSDNGKEITQHYSQPHDLTGRSYIHPDHCWYISGGSFVKMYDLEIEGDSYSEEAGYDPTELGCVCMAVRRGKPVSAEKIIL